MFWGCIQNNQSNVEEIKEEQSPASLQEAVEEMPFPQDTTEYMSPSGPFRILEIRSDAEKQNSTKLNYPLFSIIFYEYGVQETRSDDTTQFSVLNENGKLSYRVKVDTLKLVEDVFNDLSSILIKIIPKNKDDSFRISYSLKESMREQKDQGIYNFQMFKSKEEYLKANKNWEKNRVSWDCWTENSFVPDSLNYYFRMPMIDLNAYEDAIKQRMGLRDTLVDFSGESDDIATVVYKNKPCYYGIERALLKIERLVGDKVKEKKMISIKFTSGC